jgi:fructose-1,6-bisphosphatase/sedoheptulose 1,7-bisphosphatase-like protein
MEINALLTIPTAYENGKEIAKIDNTDINDVKVILIDRPRKYIQRFFVKAELTDLVERTRTMRDVGIESL